MALNAATKLSEWAKLFAIALGVPATIAVGILAPGRRRARHPRL